jgi:hypothetical protein
MNEESGYSATGGDWPPLTPAEEAAADVHAAELRVRLLGERRDLAQQAPGNGRDGGDK